MSSVGSRSLLCRVIDPRPVSYLEDCIVDHCRSFLGLVTKVLKMSTLHISRNYWDQSSDTFYAIARIFQNFSAYDYCVRP